MLTFLSLCLLSRLAYSLNDIFTGRLSRQFGRLEVAALRGLSLGLTMAPLLFWVPRAAWMSLGERWPQLLLTVGLTAAANLLQNQAARLLPFGLRAAFIFTGTSVGGLLLGWLVLRENLAALQVGLAALLVASAIVAATGEHATHEIKPNIRLGAIVGIAAAALMSWIAYLVRELSNATHPLLTAWAWEFGSGVVLIVPLLWSLRRDRAEGLLPRWWRILLASSPTVVGSGASMIAVTLGQLGLWAAMGGTQVLMTALLGALWHHETVGVRRWLCFAVAALAVAGLALVRI